MSFMHPRTLRSAVSAKLTGLTTIVPLSTERAWSTTWFRRRWAWSPPTPGLTAARPPGRPCQSGRPDAPSRTGYDSKPGTLTTSPPGTDDELDPALTAGPWHGHDLAQTAVRIGFTAAGTAEPAQMPVRIGYALAMAEATGAPVRVADQLMNQLAVPAQGDLVDQFTRDVPLHRRCRGWPRLLRRHPPVRMATR